MIVGAVIVVIIFIVIVPPRGATIHVVVGFVGRRRSSADAG
jgi:hypothetical protein